MNKTEVKKIAKVVEELDWTFDIVGYEISFQKYSPAGQDFNIEVIAENLEELAVVLQERYDNFDVSEETYLWLDDTGHGNNGAPYDMKDLYEDMEECEKMLEELAIKITEIV